MERKTETIGIIGGTGLDSLEGFDAEDKLVKTHYGNIYVRLGELSGKKVVFAPRHGLKHTVPPHKVNYRGNIAALKMEGCEAVYAFSSVGSMRPENKPGDFVVPDSWFLYNVNRPNTFFEEGMAIHIDPEPPVCGQLSSNVIAVAADAGHEDRSGGIYLCIQGPHFLTKDESDILSSTINAALNTKGKAAEIIGMSIYPEAVLAREAEMCYCMIAMVTDYNKLDGFPHVSVDAVIAAAAKNNEKAREIIPRIVAAYESKDCACRHSLDTAVQSYHPELAKDEFAKSLIENALQRKK